MKILIKCLNSTYHLLKIKKYPNHIGGYHVFNHFRTWKKLGHQVEFIGEKLTPNDWQNYDVLFFRGFNSFRNEAEFAIKILKEFKGKKILYLEGGDEGDIGQYFDTVFIPELPIILEKWKTKYPNKDIRPIAWTSPEFELMDTGDNPYPDKKFRIIFTGIFNNRYLNNFRDLAKLGENIVLGGIYYDGKICRRFTKEEMKSLPPNIQVIGSGGIFTFGTHFPYLRYADLAICFYPYKKPGALSSKLVEYLCCGIPVVGEDTVPNKNRILQYKAGLICKWNNFDSLYQTIYSAKCQSWDRQLIQDKARYFHNPDKICEEILK